MSSQEFKIPSTRKMEVIDAKHASHQPKQCNLLKIHIVTKEEMVFLKWQTKAPKTKLMGLLTWSTNKQKYSNISIKKGRLRSKLPITKCNTKKKRIKTYSNNTASNLFTFIDFSRRQKYSLSSAFIRLRTMQYKRQEFGQCCVKTHTVQ